MSATFSSPLPQPPTGNTIKPSSSTTTTTTTVAGAASSTIPDIHTLTSWEAAFSTLPLPGLRRLESQLRAQITEHRARLRSLVGAHYRDLLGTADRIVDMHAQTACAERIMSDSGRRCNASVLERGVRNVGSRVGSRVGERERKLVAGKVLRAAIAGCARIVRRQGDGLAAAKMLVLARLLVKGLGDEDGAEELRGRLGRAREGLLGYISRRLGVMTVGKEETVGVLCAYALITSSAPGDVLRFFLQVRQRQIEELGEKPREEQLLEMLELYRRTLLDVREVFPRRFADGLAQLSKIALVKDAQMKASTGLNLDVYEQWISEDARNFTPWFRHDQLSSSDLGTVLASWAKKAQECLIQGLKDALKGMVDAEAVLELRHKVLSKFLSLSTMVRDQGHSQAIDHIRTVFLARLGALAESTSVMLPFDMVSQSEEKNGNIWEMALENIDLDKGALKFRQAILQRQNGRSVNIESVTAVLDEWSSQINGFQHQIRLMSTTKWDDDIDADLDELEDGDTIQTTLVETDPQQLTSKLCESTADTLRHVYSQIEAQSNAGADAALLIRVVREVDKRRRSLSGLLERTDSVKADDELIAALHQQIAEFVLRDPIKQFIGRLKHHSPTAVILWDGAPPLPVQPSPNTFRFLSSLHRAMSAAGNDLWSVEAVRKLQEGLAVGLAEQLGDLPEIDHSDADDGANPQDNGSEDAEETGPELHELRREQSLQRLFDTLYLSRILTPGNTKEVPSQLDQAVEKLTEGLRLEQPLAERLRKNANEYWRKTHLLFGLITAVERP